MKFCKDCIHKDTQKPDYPYSKCMRPLGEFDPVTGIEKIADTYCNIERDHFFFIFWHCGKIGRFFERKGK